MHELTAAEDYAEWQMDVMREEARAARDEALRTGDYPDPEEPPRSAFCNECGEERGHEVWCPIRRR